MTKQRLIPFALLYALAATLAGCAPVPLSDQDPEATPAAVGTTYLIRHAEVLADGNSDPLLSPAGEARAACVAALLDDRGITRIYSTGFARTTDTAQIIAEASGLMPVMLYAPDDLSTFAQRLKKRGDTALVVGHSNTTPMLAGLLSSQSLEWIPEDKFDRLYTVSPEGEVSIGELECSDGGG